MENTEQSTEQSTEKGMRGLLITPKGEVRKVKVSGLDDMQKLVGGERGRLNVDCIHPPAGGIDLWVADDFLSFPEEEINFILRADPDADPISVRGNILALGVDDAKGESRSLTDEDALVVLTNVAHFKSEIGQNLTLVEDDGTRKVVDAIPKMSSVMNRPLLALKEEAFHHEVMEMTLEFEFWTEKGTQADLDKIKIAEKDLTDRTPAGAAAKVKSMCEQSIKDFAEETGKAPTADGSPLTIEQCLKEIKKARIQGAELKKDISHIAPWDHVRDDGTIATQGEPSQPSAEA